MLPSPEQMTQYAPYPSALASLVERAVYRPGWLFRLAGLDRDRDEAGNLVGGGLTLIVTTLGLNTYKPSDGETYLLPRGGRPAKEINKEEEA